MRNIAWLAALTLGVPAVAAISVPSSTTEIAGREYETLLAGCEGVPEAAMIVGELREREEKQKAYIQELARKEAEIENARAKLGETLRELRSLKDSTKSKRGTQTGVREKDISQIIAVYENMKPQRAAEVLESLPPDFAAEILMRTSPDVGAQIFGALEANSAAILTTYMGARHIDR